MTDQQTLTSLDLDDIAARAAALYEYATVTDPEGQAALNELTDTDVPALLDTVRRLRADLAAARANGIRYAADLVTQAFHGEPFLNYPPDFADLLRDHADRLTAAASKPTAAAAPAAVETGE
jgi:hypothetical protein